MIILLNLLFLANSLSAHVHHANKAILTDFAQSIIHKHQNPKNCSQFKLAITDGHEWGMGSEMHVVGSHLADAMNHGFILTWGAGSCSRWVNETTCHAGCECIYQKLTHCPLIHVVKHYRGEEVRFSVPHILHSRLRQEFPAMTENQIRYWWRAQSVGYVMRVQSHYLDEIQKMRSTPSLHYHFSPQLPPGTISAHIRSGDKYKEMELVQPEVFVRHYLHRVAANPLSYSRTLFVSSDNLQSIQYCVDALERKGHTVIYTKMERMEGGHDISKLRDFHTNITRVVLENLLQLYMALEADGWIGTRESNWNRLIDELRCIWVDKCSMVFDEIGNLQHDYYEW